MTLSVFEYERPVCQLEGKGYNQGYNHLKEHEGLRVGHVEMDLELMVSVQTPLRCWG